MNNRGNAKVIDLAWARLQRQQRRRANATGLLWILVVAAAGLLAWQLI